MTEWEVLRFRWAARHMRSPKANLGNESRQAFAIRMYVSGSAAFARAAFR